MESRFSYINARNKTYYLHSRDVRLRNTQGTYTIYYFSTDPKKAIAMPEGKMVIENERSGLPFLKNKA